MRSAESIYRDAQRAFEELTGQRIQEGTVIDLYTVSIAKVLEKVYEEIENSKNPHLYSSLRGSNLDDLGFFLNCPRQPGEDDETYLYRLMNWLFKAESSNTTAIQDSLLNLEYASNAEFIPLSNGSGTASVYIIPKEYDEEIIARALEEVKTRIEPVVSPSLYIEYIIPKIKRIVLHLHVETKDGDMSLIRSNITDSLKEYINAIPPGEHLEVGEISRIGINTPGVSYFQVLQMFVDGREEKETKILQTLDSKFILDEEIIWS